MCGPKHPRCFPHQSLYIETGSLTQWILPCQLFWLASFTLGFPVSTVRLTSPPDFLWILEIPTLGFIPRVLSPTPTPVSCFKLGRLNINARLWAVAGLVSVTMLELPFLCSKCCWSYPASYLPAPISLCLPALQAWQCMCVCVYVPLEGRTQGHGSWTH